MAKKPSITTVASGYQSTTTINDNTQNLRDAFDNTLSLDGSTPNAMQADLDINSNDIINVNKLYINGLYIDGQPVSAGTLNYNGVIKETQTATSGQTVFNLNTMTYNPGINSLSVYVDGVYQNPSTYTENNTSRITFSAGLHVGAVVDFVALSINEITGAADASSVTYSPTAQSLYGTSTITVKSALDQISNEGTGSSKVGFLQSGTGATNRTAQAKLRDTVSVKDFGAVGNGIADDRAAILAAVAAASDKTLFFPAGAYRVNSPIVVSQKVSWLFEGPTGPLSVVTPTAYILKGAACAGDCLTFTGQSNVLDGVAVVGEVGNTGNGIVLAGNSPYLNRPFVTKMGQDGIRIGTDVTGCNVNSFTLINARCISNLRDGINISEVTVNANAGSFINPICTQNGRHGFYGNTAALGVTIVCPTFESNTGYGAYLDTNFGYIGANAILGGDIEANVAGNVYEAVPYQTEFVGVSVQGKTVNSRAQNGAYTPVLTGSSTAGTATYSTQQGSYAVAGGSVNFYVSIAWTGHTGTGQGYVNIPVPCYNALPVPLFFPASIIMSGVTLGAGFIVKALVSRQGQRIQLYQENDSTGALSSLAVPASGSLYISGSYPLNVPNFNYINYP